MLVAPEARTTLLGALRAPLGNQFEASLDYVRIGAGELVQEQFPLTAVEGLDARLDGQFRTSPVNAG